MDFFRVGVFDSGIGGLTVLNECAKNVGATYFYYGDNQRAPYGNRPKEQITRFVGQGLKALSAYKIDAAILACNTATTVCIDEMRRRFPFPVLGTEPAVALAAKTGKNVLVLSTVQTAGSARLHTLIAQYPQCRFTVFGVKGLAAAIENYCTKGGSLCLSDYLPKGNFDAVVLGCTHYVFLKKEIASFYSAPVFDGNLGVANRLKCVLDGLKLEKVGTTDHQKGRLTTKIESDIIRENITNSHLIFVKNNKICNKQTYERMFVS